METQNLFSHLKNINSKKGPYLGDEGWNNFMINKFLSMNPDYVEIVNTIQRNTWQMKGEYLYNLYKDLIPKNYNYIKYIKATAKKEYDKIELEIVADYYKVSQREAKDYIDLLSNKELENIIKQTNGK